MKTRLVVSALALVLFNFPAHAQTSQTFHACYVSEVGVMYLIQLPGLPTQCLAPAHREISWTEGGGGTGELADGSVTTTKLADEAVTGAKLGPGAVTAGKVGAGAIGTTELADASVAATKLADEAVTHIKIASGAVGTAQLADGSVSSIDLQEGAVTASKLGSDVSLPPSNCSIDEIAKWDGSGWVCSAPGPTTLFMRVLKDGTVDLSNFSGVSVSNGGNGFYQVTLPFDATSCAILAKEERDVYGQKFYVKFERTAVGFSYNTEKETGDWQLVVNWLIVCP